MNSSTSTSSAPTTSSLGVGELRRVRPAFFVWLVLSALIGALVASLASAFGSADLAPQLLFAAARRADVVVFGNSVNRTRSHCDRDLRDLADMLKGELAGSGRGPVRRSVRDVSSGGMHNAEHIAQARLLVARRAAKVLVLPAVAGQIEEQAAGDHTDRVRVAAYLALAGGAPSELIAALRAPAANKSVGLGPQLDPQGFSARRDAFMQIEKNAESCPEQKASNVEFMRFMYRNKIRSLPREVSLPPTLTALAREAVAANVTLVLFAPPFATELLEQEGMRAELEHVEAYAASLARAASALPARFVDLHAALPASAFTDAWCACGHLKEEGRAAVARALAHEIAASARATP